MFYTNSKCLNCCDNSDFECHSENIVAEEMECTAIIDEHEKNFQPTQYYVNKNINKTLVSSLASTSLIALSMLGVANGVESSTNHCKTKYENIASSFCITAGNICRIMGATKELKKINTSTSEIIEKAIDYSSKTLELERVRSDLKRYDLDSGLPLDISSNIDRSKFFNYDCDKTELVNSMYEYMISYLYSYFHDNIKANIESPGSRCTSQNTLFCNRGDPKISTFIKCCPGIGEYVVYDGLPALEKKIPTVSDNVINAITKSTTAISSDIVSRTDTILNSTAMEKTLPVDNNISILTIALVVILPLTLIIFSALGYRTYKSKKSHNPQNLPKSDNVSNHQEEIEDLV
ncbi:hypothetical protein [Candidatus Ichthyocystis sparus]|uniref:hypothetical protein n=1 Tax=Candidatus Ichthyocystis sparus TaxID=1561004 RepID=UPI000B87D593|nr:hypothetical protein [Candidatus Ichthyocystis sparus]